TDRDGQRQSGMAHGDGRRRTATCRVAEWTDRHDAVVGSRRRPRTVSLDAQKPAAAGGWRAAAAVYLRRARGLDGTPGGALAAGSEGTRSADARRLRTDPMVVPDASLGHFGEARWRLS